jgi:hypothetical protein
MLLYLARSSPSAINSMLCLYYQQQLFSSYDVDNQNEILFQSEHNRVFGVYLMGELGHLFNSLEKEIQRRISQWARKWLEEKYDYISLLCVHHILILFSKKRDKGILGK